MTNVTRYYARKIIKTGKIIVEKSENLIRKDYVHVLRLSHETPFEMISEDSPEYETAVQIFINTED